MKYNKFGFVLCALVAAASVGCGGDKESAHHFDNKIFISATGFTNEVRIEENVQALSRSIIVKVAQPEGYDIEASFRAAPELLATYREAYYDENVLLLPESHYDLTGVSATISAGKVASDPLTLDFVDLDQLDLDSKYVLPVTISSVNGVDILRSARTIYYIFKEASLVNVVADMKENRAWPDWENFSEVEDMTAFTMEALIYGHAFKNEIATIMGIEDVFLVRIGDTGIPKSQIQVAYASKDQQGAVQRGSVTNAQLKLQTGRWYHVAVTFDSGEIKVYLDGKMKASGSSAASGVTAVNFKVAHSDEDDGKPRCFWIGYSYDDKRYLDGMISEARMWNRALTMEEIQAENHFYKVDPASAGLVAYWKFDEGEGNVVKDHTACGNNLSTETDLKWYPVELPAKE